MEKIDKMADQEDKVKKETSEIIKKSAVYVGSSTDKYKNIHPFSVLLNRANVPGYIVIDNEPTHSHAVFLTMKLFPAAKVVVSNANDEELLSDAGAMSASKYLEANEDKFSSDNRSTFAEYVKEIPRVLSILSTVTTNPEATLQQLKVIQPRTPFLDAVINDLSIYVVSKSIPESRKQIYKDLANAIVATRDGNEVTPKLNSVRETPLTPGSSTGNLNIQLRNTPMFPDHNTFVQNNLGAKGEYFDISRMGETVKDYREAFIMLNRYKQLLNPESKFFNFGFGEKTKQKYRLLKVILNAKPEPTVNLAKLRYDFANKTNFNQKIKNKFAPQQPQPPPPPQPQQPQQPQPQQPQPRPPPKYNGFLAGFDPSRSGGGTGQTSPDNSARESVGGGSSSTLPIGINDNTNPVIELDSINPEVERLIQHNIDTLYRGSDGKYNGFKHNEYTELLVPYYNPLFYKHLDKIKNMDSEYAKVEELEKLCQQQFYEEFYNGQGAAGEKIFIGEYISKLLEICKKVEERFKSIPTFVKPFEDIRNTVKSFISKHKALVFSDKSFTDKFNKLKPNQINTLESPNEVNLPKDIDVFILRALFPSRVGFFQNKNPKAGNEADLNDYLIQPILKIVAKHQSIIKQVTDAVTNVNETSNVIIKTKLGEYAKSAPVVNFSRFIVSIGDAPTLEKPDPQGGGGDSKGLLGKIGSFGKNIAEIHKNNTVQESEMKQIERVFGNSSRLLYPKMLQYPNLKPTTKKNIYDHIGDVYIAHPDVKEFLGNKDDLIKNTDGAYSQKIPDYLRRINSTIMPRSAQLTNSQPQEETEPDSEKRELEQRLLEQSRYIDQLKNNRAAISDLNTGKQSDGSATADGTATRVAQTQRNLQGLDDSGKPLSEDEQLLATIKNIKDILGKDSPLVNQLTTALINKQAPATATTVYPVQTPNGLGYTAVTNQVNPFSAAAQQPAPLPQAAQQAIVPKDKQPGFLSSKRLAEDRFESVIKSMVQYEMFVDAMRKKEVVWTTAVNNKSYLQDITRQKTEAAKDDKASTKKRSYVNCLNIIGKTSNMLLSRAEKAYDDIKTFHIKSNRSDVKNIITYLRDENIRVQKIQDATERTKAQERPKKVYDQFNKLQTALRTDTDNYFTNIVSKIDTIETEFQQLVAVMQHSIEEKNQAMSKELDAKRERINLLRNKILSIYNLNYSMTDILFDHQFIIMYVIKGIRILFMYIALFLATRIFIPMYEVAVYDNKTSPPALWKYLLIFLGFDLAFNAFLVVTLYLLMFIFSSPDNTFPINKYLFMKYLMDYVMSMSLLLIISYIVSTVIVTKKYFKYKYEGPRAIRAFESLVFKVGIVIVLLPFFWVAA